MDRDTERVVALTLLLVLATVFAPALAKESAAGIGHWLLAHHILVPAATARVVLPYTGAGLDDLRLIIIALVLVATVSLTAAGRRRTPKKSPS